MMAFWLLIKPFAPWMAIALALLGIYAYGYHNGVSKWHDKYDAAVVASEHNAAEADKLKTALEDQNRAIDTLKAEGDAALERVETAHSLALARQSASYQRAIDKRDRDAAALRERVKLMTVAETCHEAWVEMAK